MQAANPTTAATVAAAFTTLAHFINVPFGLLIREVLKTDATPVSKFRPPSPAGNCIKFDPRVAARRNDLSRRTRMLNSSIVHTVFSFVRDSRESSTRGRLPAEALAPRAIQSNASERQKLSRTIESYLSFCEIPSVADTDAHPDDAMNTSLVFHMASVYATNTGRIKRHAWVGWRIPQTRPAKPRGI